MSSILDQLAQQMTALVANSLPEEAKARVSALLCSKAVLPLDADVYDRIRVARYIVTGSEDEPEVALAPTLDGGDALTGVVRPRTYPFPEGDVTVLGPEIFASTDDPADDTVICWRGANFTRQPELPEELAPGLPNLTVAEPAPSAGEGWQGRRG